MQKKPSILETPLAVIGPGAWGTALALAALRNEQPVRLWGNDLAQMESLIATRRNEPFLPGIELPPTLELCNSLSSALKDVRDVLVVVPSIVFREVMASLKPFLHQNLRISWGTKGLDPHSGEMMHQVAQDVLGKNIPLAALSGPTFAKEVAQNLPSAIVVASTSNEFANDLITRFEQDTFRVTTSHDLVGVQIGGVVKNVIAIAVGISEGLGFGANARSLLITRGLAEIAELNKVLGGYSETLMGLSGVGDLVLTCTDDQSRNRRFGLALGKGQTVEDSHKKIGQVVEGMYNAREVFLLAQRLKVKMPIVESIYRIIYEHLAPAATMTSLLQGRS